MEDYITELDAALGRALDHCREELGAIRGNRPSVELVENIKLTYYDQPMTVKQLGSLSVEPPRNVLITVWDQAALNPIMKAIADSHIGLSTSNEGNTIRASMADLTRERRDELIKVVKKIGEATRISIRNHRDDTMKAIRNAKDKKELSEDQEFTLKEKAQKSVDAANKQVEAIVDQKVASLNE